MSTRMCRLMTCRRTSLELTVLLLVVQSLFLDKTLPKHTASIPSNSGRTKKRVNLLRISKVHCIAMHDLNLAREKKETLLQE